MSLRSLFFKYIYFILAVCLLLCILIFPQATITGSKSGLSLWFFTLLPSLLPCMILSLYIQQFPILKRLGYYRYTILIGFLCGYPMGAKTACDLYKNCMLTKEQVCRLIGFCNNASPSFLINYVYLQFFSEMLPLWKFLLLFYIPPIAVGILMSFAKKMLQNSFSTVSNQAATHTSNLSPCSRIDFDGCILNSFLTITKIGGYILLFSILSCLLLQQINLENRVGYLFASLLEVTSGVCYLSQSNYLPNTKLLLCGILCSFGGICTIAQTFSICKEAKFALIFYLAQKLLQIILFCFLFSILF